MCTNIERAISNTMSSYASNIQLEIIFNIPLQDNIDEYQCQFHLTNDKEFFFCTNALPLDDKALKCLPPILNDVNQTVYNVVLSVHHVIHILINLYGVFKQ
ncbi:unnamed protein product [Rotaria sp. Silwood2]|nr:unnamed protein product [Rotaria sp. Silwood2]CAF3061359.1 unnamed protein product [Rotaria sp. Silwood2]CAF3303711.1 unnamed protein product [Rotaria sp. Silwood2]CAF3376961.1 unnamed protein product [Rotaria sp. Silwood2]CAF4202670.1 unnamed protein product [Rotaria sp. Silwood2]